ncbi:MAG: histidine phosphatase family protein [Synergistaceae bacterium]|jgi:broad specificity phosphatase PhoE|nr:histidine phosphatase family protein [Synergistaceae bacterium]
MSCGSVSGEKKGPEKLQIFMLRHGKPQFPGEDSYVYGHTDYPLSEFGARQAAGMGKVLSGIRMDRIISSDLARAAGTARIVAGMQSGGGAEVEFTAEIREVFMGEWDGLPKKYVTEKFPGLFRDRGLDLENVAPPGGESFAMMRDRGMRFMSRLVGESAGIRRVLIVAHGGILWGMISSLFGIRLGDMFRFGLDYCALHLVEYSRKPEDPESFRLVRYNWSPDLAVYEDLVH